MGGVNSTITKATSIVESASASACKLQQAVDQNMNVRLDLTDTNCPNLSFTNKAKLVGTCNMGAIADSLAQASTALNNSQTVGLGLGINVNTSVSDRSNIIKQKLEQNCGSEQGIKQTLNLDIKGKNLTCQQLQALNDADLTTQCILNTVNQAVTNDTFQAVSAQKSDILGSLTALFSAPILILIAILLAIGAIFLLFRLFRRSTPTEQPLQQGGETVAPEIEVNSVPEVNTVPEVTLETPETPTPASLSQLYRRSRRAPRSGASVGRSNVSYHKRY